jgi:co-chaperonin GroES (HSP10)
MKGATLDYLFVQVEKLWEDRVELADGKYILKDTDSNPNLNKRTYGKVVGLPKRLSVQDREMEARIGDTVHFHFNCLMDFNRIKPAYLSEMGVDSSLLIYRIDYKLCYVLERDCFAIDLDKIEEKGLTVKDWIDYLDKTGVMLYRDDIGKPLSFKNPSIIPINGYCLAKEKKESWESITSPSGILMKTSPAAIPHRAVVTHVGKPLKGEESLVAVEDEIFFHKDMFVPITIRGERYFRIEQVDVTAKFE